MSDHCMVLLNDTHAILNAGEWLAEGDAMTGDSYIFDSISLEFTKGIFLRRRFSLSMLKNTEMKYSKFL